MKFNCGIQVVIVHELMVPSSLKLYETTKELGMPGTRGSQCQGLLRDLSVKTWNMGEAAKRELSEGILARKGQEKWSVRPCLHYGSTVVP